MMCRSREPSLRYGGRCRPPINHSPSKGKVKVRYMIVIEKLCDLQGVRTVKIAILGVSLGKGADLLLLGGFFFTFLPFCCCCCCFYFFSYWWLMMPFPIGATTTVTIPCEWEQCMRVGFAFSMSLFLELHVNRSAHGHSIGGQRKMEIMNTSFPYYPQSVVPANAFFLPCFLACLLMYLDP